MYYVIKQLQVVEIVLNCATMYLSVSVSNGAITLITMEASVHDAHHQQQLKIMTVVTMTVTKRIIRMKILMTQLTLTIVPSTNADEFDTDSPGSDEDEPQSTLCINIVNNIDF